MGFRYIEGIGLGVNKFGMSCKIRENAAEASPEAPPRRVEEDLPVWSMSVTFRTKDSCHTGSFYEFVGILVKAKDVSVEYGKRVLKPRAVLQSLVKDIKTR